MKTKHFLGMMAGAWMLASCSNQDELLQQEEVMTGQRVTVNAYVPDDTDSRLVFEDQGTGGLKVSWKETGESFSVMTADAAEPVTFTQTEGSEFAGPQDFTFDAGTQYYAFYPKLDEVNYGEWDPNTEQVKLNVSAKAIPYDISEQTGKLDESMNLMYAKRSADGDFQFEHMLAVMKFTLKGIKGELFEGVHISFDLDSEPYYTIGTVDVTEDPTFTSDSYYGYVDIPAEELTRNNEGNYEFYAYLPPLAAGTQITIEAGSMDEECIRIYGDDFSINESGIKAGMYYTAARTMDKVEEFAFNHTAGTVEELKAWIDAVQMLGGMANLTLTDDIDLSEADLDGDGTNDSNWPNNLPVLGTVDGGGHSITGIKINSGENFYAAPFIIGPGGVVKNLRLEEVNISGMYASGITILNEGTISGCSVSGSVTALGSSASGIVANNLGTVTGCYNVATVTGVDYYIGGIAGENEGTITACYNTGALSATQPDENTYIGGIAGVNNYKATITACYWSAAGVNNGIGYDYNNTALPSDEGATKVDGEVTWDDAAAAMNGALPAGFEWKWVKNTDENTRTEIPLVLQDVVK